MPSPRAFLIDGTACCYRAFYAIRQLSTSDGRPTNAVYGVAMILQALRQHEHPAYWAVAFDVGKPTFRHRQFEAYKAQRKPMPEPLIGQLPLVKALLAACRIPVFEQEGFEAEDVLATIAQRIAQPGLDIVFVTGDKDMLQLVNSHTKVYNPHQDGATLDADAVRNRYGVAPEQIVDLLALMGDAIDNIPSVPGIGEKTAVALLQQFGSIERLYERLQDVESPSRREALATHRAQIEQSQQLARIDRDVPVQVRLDKLTVQEPDWRRLRQLYRELEFKRLLQQVDSQRPAESTHAIDVQLVQTPAELEQLVASDLVAGLSPVAILAIPDESADEDRVALAMTSRADQAQIVRVDPDAMGTPAGMRLAQWLADAARPKLGHDVKGMKRRLSRLGLAVGGLQGDTMVAAHLVNPARTSQTLSDLSDEWLEQPLGVLDSPPVWGRAVVAVLPLHARLVDALRERQLEELYRTMELPLIDVLAQMEAVGIAIDVEYLAGLRAAMQAKLLHLTEEIHRLAGGAFNIQSPKQLAQVLFERLQLPVIKRTKTGASTDSDVLQQLAPKHPLPQRLMEYRELSKLVSTYVEALPKLADPTTHRLHTSFNQAATATGRLSSSEPNLQNIPIKTELGRSIRKAFVPGMADGLLLAADYTQIELRILAHLSEDERLLDAFARDRDIHRVTAALIYGIPEAEVQPEQRSAMKAINYGILYGMTSHGLSKELGIGFEEAQAFIDAYFERYPRVRTYLDQQIMQAKRDGFVQTLLGRRRYIPEVNSPDPAVRQLGERMAVNAPIQGTAADLIKRAMIRMAQELSQPRWQARMVLQVHDELIFETPRHALQPLAALVRQVMEQAMTLRVPLTVTVKAGPNWLDLAPITERWLLSE